MAAPLARRRAVSAEETVLSETTIHVLMQASIALAAVRPHAPGPERRRLSTCTASAPIATARPAGPVPGALAESCAGAHGRLRLGALEPSLEAAIARPEGGAFFGHTDWRLPSHG